MFDDIILFIKLVEVGSFSQLAKLLNSSQATVSRRIQSLEENLGVTLLNRNQRHLEVTHDGQMLYEQFKKPATNLESSWRLVCEELQDELQGTIRLALTTEGARDIILPKLQDFLNEHPRARLHVTFTTQAIHLVKQHYDIAISSSLPESAAHTVTILSKFKFKPYASPEYIKKYGAPTNLDELLTHRCIGSLGFAGEENNNYKAENLKTGEEKIISYTSRLYMDTTSHAAIVAKHGEFITGAWDAVVTNEVARGELVEILPDYSFFEIPCFLVRKTGITSKLEQTFAEFIIKVFNESLHNKMNPLTEPL